MDEWMLISSNLKTSAVGLKERDWAEQPIGDSRPRDEQFTAFTLSQVSRCLSSASSPFLLFST